MTMEDYKGCLVDMTDDSSGLLKPNTDEQCFDLEQLYKSKIIKDNTKISLIYNFFKSSGFQALAKASSDIPYVKYLGDNSQHLALFEDSTSVIDLKFKIDDELYDDDDNYYMETYLRDFMKYANTEDFQKIKTLMIDFLGVRNHPQLHIRLPY